MVSTCKIFFPGMESLRLGQVGIIFRQSECTHLHFHQWPLVFSLLFIFTGPWYADFNFCSSRRHERVSYSGFNVHFFLITNEVTHLFKDILAIPVFSSVKYLVCVFCSLFLRLWIFFLVITGVFYTASILQTLSSNSLLVIWCNYLLPIWGDTNIHSIANPNLIML